MAEKIKLQLGAHTMIGEIEHAAEYIAVYMEIDSKSFKSCAEFISDDEHRALMEQRKKLLSKHKKVELPDFGLGSDNET